MTIGRMRSLLYAAARLLGHVNAGKRAARTGSVEPIARRAARVYAGKATSRALRGLFR